MSLPITYEEMRSLVLEAVAKADRSQVKALCTEIAQLAVARDLIKKPAGASSYPIMGESHGLFSRHDEARVWSIIWDLIIEGIVRPGLDDGTNNELPFYHVTEYGKSAIANGPQSPYDPDGYLNRLKATIPNLDPVILTYLNESLHTFRIGCLLSSSVTLGCASEKAMLLLIDAYASALPSGATKDRFIKATEGKMIKTQYDEFLKMLDGHLRAKLPKKPVNLQDEIDMALSGIFPMLRELRNKAGHPTGLAVGREIAYASLVVFPTMLRRLYEIINWLPTASL